MGVIRSNIAQWTRPLRHSIRDWYENNTRMGYWRKAQRNYRNRTGQSLNYKYPNDINEKLMWMERYWQHPLKTICADKYQVREYIAKHGMTDMLVPLLGVYESANQIDFAVLPNKFVLKCNHGCGYNIICLDKSKLDINETREQLSAWLKEDWDQFSCEIHYHDIPHKIICEQLLSDTAPIEYQVWCVNGKADSILACRKNYDGTYDAWSYSLEWEHLNDRNAESKGELPRPGELEKLIRCAELLAQPFPFLRADFYDVKGKLFFAEMTFSPCANVLTSYKEAYIKRIGVELKLPRWKWPATNWKVWHKNTVKINRFVTEMNSTAKMLGMELSYFDDVTGLSYLNNMTVRDAARLLKEVLQYPNLVSKMAIPQSEIFILHRGAPEDYKITKHSSLRRLYSERL